MTFQTMTFIERLLALPAKKKEQNLKNIEYLVEKLGRPERDFLSIHIAGTNGKGSVATKIANSLFFSGYKVGLYTSPHLVFFTERIIIDNKKIEEREAEECLEKIFSIVDASSLTFSFFEVVTALCFMIFSKKKVEVAVIEVGLGGRLDATNIIEPIVSVITSISLEHTDILGDTVEKIAQEKAGIIKPKVPVVLGPFAQETGILRRAKELKSECFCVSEKADFFDEENQHIAKEALSVLRRRLPLLEKAIEEGIRLRPRCRFEEISKEMVKEKKFPSRIILDAAHNSDGFVHLFRAIEKKYPKKKFRVLSGFCKDKDMRSCLEVVAAKASSIHLVEIKSLRKATLEEMKREVKKEKWKKLFLGHEIKEEFLFALEEAYKRKEILVVCGSFYLMKDILEEIEKKAGRSSSLFPFIGE